MAIQGQPSGGSPPVSEAEGPLCAEVAVPLPIPETLTYEVPEALRRWVAPGTRVRVPVARRRLTGLIMALREAPPAGISLRAVHEVLDTWPVVDQELLELARFTADYYLAPIGEVVRAMIPGDLPAWGERRVRLTNAGALASPQTPGERAVIEALREEGRLRAGELARRVNLPDLPRVLENLAQARWVVVDAGRTSGARYVRGVELPAGDLEAQLAACGRSPQGRAVVEYLAAIRRPATVAEVTSAIGCTPAVVRRLVTLGVLRQFTQVEHRSLARHVLGVSSSSPLTLRPDQRQAVEEVSQALEEGAYVPFLLAGMAGSGKTEVYLAAVEKTLELGRSAILLVPEIALVPALARTIQERYGDALALLHSGLDPGERHQEWERIRRGEARVVLGPRSAVFAPVVRLGLVAVDEEHDPSYKQQTTPRYHGRDLALVRARNARAVALLVSATPSLESRHNVERGRYRRLVLTERVGQGAPPEGILVDLREEGRIRRPGEVHFSQRLQRELEEALEAGDQVILLRNRRGYSPLYLCRACGEDMRCEQCGLPRTYHRREGQLLCHYCGSTRQVPERCPTCGEAAMEPMGTGTERVEEEFRSLFPNTEVAVLDRDAVRRGSAAAVLERFASGSVQVLIGTQMVSKGHHFPRVALTAVLAADTYLSFPDFRAVERTYSLLTQLAGRAGRGERPGRVVIQTYHPHHYAIRAALEGDDKGFAREEMRFRRIFHYPPFTRMVQLLIRHRKRDRVVEAAGELGRRLAVHPMAQGVRISGPAPAPLERLRGQWRYQLLLRSPSPGRLRRLLRQVLPETSAYDLVVDVDPYDLM